jgi:hypothetical protein
MDTEIETQHPHSHLFTLRLWQEALGEGQAEWRGRVQEIASDETAFFRDWSGLIAVLTRMTSSSVPARDGAPAGEGPTGLARSGADDS